MKAGCRRRHLGNVLGPAAAWPASSSPPPLFPAPLLFPSSWRLRSSLSGGLALVVALLLTLGASARELPFQRAAPGTQLQDLPKTAPAPAAAAVAPGELVDAGDVYTVPGRGAVRLLRSKTQIAVRFAEGVPREDGLRAVRALRGVRPHEAAGRAVFRGGGAVEFLRSTDRTRPLEAAALRAAPAVRSAYPVLYDPKTKLRLAPTDEILARFAPGTQAAEIAAAATAAGLRLVGRVGPAALESYRFRLVHPKTADPLIVARQLAAQPRVRWAQPNFVREFQHFFTPGNPLFPQQQTLRNTGQNGALPAADVEAPAAWDQTTGHSGIVVAIIDDGVDTAHPGLRIFQNLGESGPGQATDGIDNDGNGLIDDVQGWDFADADNQPSPVGTNGHGTACAGIAAGTFGAATKTAGIAPGCTILPVKIADDTGEFTTDEIIGSAITYAAQYADVLSNSWGGGSESAFINDAIDYATVQGRGGKGCPVFFASGNGASTWYQGGGRYRLSTQGLSGAYYFSFALVKGVDVEGEDKVRIDNVCLLGSDGYTHLTSVLGDQDFEWFNPTLGNWWLFSSTGLDFWSLESDNALTGTGGFLSATSPAMASGEVAWLFAPLMQVTGQETLAFAGSISIAEDSELYVAVYEPNPTTGNLDFFGAYGPLNGVPEPDPAITYPANQPNAISVGASTDRDLRADFSQWQGALDFVAPSNGGWNDVSALDPLGAVGWTPEDFKTSFGGTSAATPLAAGIAALMLSRQPDLTALEIRTLLRQTCDQIGFEPYSNGVAPHYGHGRVNAARAVAAALPAIQVADEHIAEVAPGSTTTATLTFTLTEPTVRDVTFEYATSDDSALAGIHYTAASGIVTFPAGSTTRTFSITIQGALLTQPNRVFFVNLTAPANATLARPRAVIFITAQDSDEDGAADYWEQANEFDPADPADGPLDRDGDGQSNAAEFFAGTDPTAASDVLRITNWEKTVTGYRVRFPSVAGRVYQIEASPVLSPPKWSEVKEIQGTGAELSVEVPSPLDATHFYRVRVAR